MSREIYRRVVGPHQERVSYDGGVPTEKVNSLIALAEYYEQEKNSIKLMYFPALTGNKIRTSGVNNFVTKGYSLRNDLSRPKRNLLTYTEEFDNAAWSKAGSSSITPNTVNNHLGVLSADTMTALVTATAIAYQSTSTIVAGNTITLSCYVKAGTRNFFGLGHYGLSDIYFDLVNLTYNNVNANFISASIVDVGNGWRRIAATWLKDANTTKANYLILATSLSSQVGLIANTDYMYIWGAQLEVGSTATEYQRVIESTSWDGVIYDSSQTVSTSQPYLGGKIALSEMPCMNRPTGSTLFLSHPTINFSQTEQWSVTSVFRWSKSGNGWEAYCGSSMGSQSILGLSYANGFNYTFYNKSGVQITGLGGKTKKLIGKIAIITYVRDSTNVLKIYCNGVLDESIVFPSNNFEIDFNTIYKPTDHIHGAFYSHVIYSKALPPSQVSIEHSLLRDFIPEMETIKIGTQTWASSNCEMAATPLGNPIQEMQAAANVEKVVNGGFDTDTNWDKTGGWSISGGTLNANINTLSYVFQTESTTLNRWYKITYTISNYISGSVLFGMGNLLATEGLTRNANGTYTEYLKFTTTSGNMYSGFKSSAFVGSIDNLSVQEIGRGGTLELYNGIYAQTAETASSVEKITNVTDRDFSGALVNWGVIETATLTPTAGKGVLTPITNYSGMFMNNLITIGKLYRIRFTHRLQSGTGFDLQLRGVLNVNGSTNVTFTPTVTEKVIDVVGFAAAVYIQVVANGVNNGSVFEIDNFSCKELGLYDTTSIFNYTYAALKAASTWRHYGNSLDNAATYGKLYNWFAIKLIQVDIDLYNSSNPTTPWGYRAPLQEDWDTLISYLGGSAVAGGKLKKEGTTYWNSPNTGADNSSGFSAVGAGWEIELNQNGYFHSLTESGDTNQSILLKNNNSVAASNFYSKTNNFSFRFIKTKTDLLYDSLSSLLTDSTGDPLYVNI